MQKNSRTYRGGPVSIVGRPARFRAGSGIRKAGERYGESHGAVREVVLDGAVVDAARFEEIQRTTAAPGRP
jgi:hypothetical protein